MTSNESLPVAKLDQKDRASFPQRARTHLAINVKTTHADVILLVCSLITGLVDSTLYNAYSTFVSMQTGNTIFIALGASGQNAKPYGWARSLISLIFFVIGCFVFALSRRMSGGWRRSALVGSFLSQACFIFLAAALIQGSVIDGRIPPDTNEIDWRQLVPVALLSFQAAGQIVESRALNLGEIPTVVVTSLLCDLISDPKLTASAKSNIKRNRRVVSFLLTLIGAIAGGWISKASRSVQAALWVAGGLKMGITFAWLLWPSASANF